MPTEQRVISSKSKIAPKGGVDTAADEGDAAPAKRSKKVMILAIVVVLLLAGGAAYWFLLKPADGETVAEPVELEPVAGVVQVVDAVSINLSGGHYLRLGLGLQLTDEVHEDIDTAPALDLAISLFTQRSLEEVSDATERDALKAELLHELEEAYEGEVMDVYFTDFVTQ